ncbi:hypothetical protein HHL28_12450 [Aerophototrophica crusticola]|uniref:CopG family transcriptional regulator n=1 Tax=Aerophototrophica crusticola TaxID=1709002 RepID=A0A858R9Y0_9PROT|nr:hypothetical protein HHL28_12450 [Rhodospirillaceae bacterium B3]
MPDDPAGTRVETPEEEGRRLTEDALRKADQGIGIPIEEVEAWLDSLGTNRELPRPQARQCF